MDYIFIFLISFMVTYIMTPMVRYVGIKYRIIDRPNERKSHQKVITRMGGVAVFAGFALGIILAGIFNLPAIWPIRDTMILLIGSSLVVLLGMFDDTRGSEAWVKLIFQFMIAILMARFGFLITHFSLPIIGTHFIGQWGAVVTVLWIVGIMNAFNFIDGLDGLGCFMTITASAFLAIICALSASYHAMFIYLILLGSCLGFLRYNIFPAKIFLGNSGSLLLGFLISIGILYPDVRGVPIQIIPVLLFMGIPFIDTVMTLMRRIKRRSIFMPDKDHLHHALMKHGFKHRVAVNILTGINAFLASIGLMLILFI